MLRGLVGKLVGDSNEREVRKLQPLVDSINRLEGDTERRIDALASSQKSRVEPMAAAITRDFRSRLAAGETLDDLLGEAFAAVREMAKRTVDMRPFDVQLIGGIVLHQGKVAEMRTGEGKTLVATMPVYLNALSRRGVHLVTVNDYLARRDTLWMGPIYYHLGLTVGLLQSGREQPAYLFDPSYQRDPYPGLRPVLRREAYAADVTYGTNNEFGFDYLRDNLALTLARRVQRPLHYAIVDEVDNIFIDEARTPLIISGPSGEPVEEYGRFAAIARKLAPELHFELDEKERTVYLTDEGLAAVERETGIENLYDEANYRYVHYMQQALKAQVLFQQGRDYIIRREGGKRRIMLVDQHTGRLMPDRRLSEGLHQAIEAKEGVEVLPRDVTSATVTIQNYFRMYEKLAGMSGTAVTEAEEFFKIYKLDVVAIPTHKPAIRLDHPDVVYRSEEAKLRAVAREILSCHCRGQPVLVGTTSVEMSERLSLRLSGERLQMASLAPRVAYALQESQADRDERARLREILNGSLETMNSASWNKLMRTVGLEHSALSGDSVTWLSDYLGLPDKDDVRQQLEHALREGIPHKVLNAKEHTGEAAIIARAGAPGAVTIATNMAGRGVDIKLGGELSGDDIHRANQALQALGLNPYRATSDQMDSAIAQVTPQYAKRREQVLIASGLHVLGTERHEARRIDNQLRGRSGRQGEPGSSRFYLSLEDDLMRRFGRREMLSKLMEQIGDDFPIEHSLVSKTLERAQTSVEGYNFDIRKHLLEYDDVLNKQRETIYGERLRILSSDDLRPEVVRMLERQVDELVEKYGEGEQQRLLFAWLDDIVALMLPAPSAPFQGPVPFAGHLTASPPFTISYLADQLIVQPPDEVRQTLRDLNQQAAAEYGGQIRQQVHEAAHAILEKYDERLARYRTLLDEKIDEFTELMAERSLPIDLRRLAQHLDRTFPLKLSTPRSGDPEHLDEIRDQWSQEIEIAFHRQTCLNFLERIQLRLPGDIRLDRLRPMRLTPEKLAEELERAVSAAAREPADEEARRRLAGLKVPERPDPPAVLELVSTLKQTSLVDHGRLDRLVGHVLGVYLDELLSRFQQAAGAAETRLRREIERLRESLDEGKRATRSDLPGLFRQLNELVHLEISDTEAVLAEALSHEYDKWAQRQLSEMESAAGNTPLQDTNWSSVVEYLLAISYVQKQVYDKEHQRRIAWTPRLPPPYLVQAYVAGLERDELREAVMTSLRSALEQREISWGRQELQRWSRFSLADLGEEAFDQLVRYLGELTLGAQREATVEDLPADTYTQLRFALALRDLKGSRLADLPQAKLLLPQLAEKWEAQLLDGAIVDLGGEVKEAVINHLRRSGAMDDPAALAALSNQPLRDWDRRTREEVAAFLGRRQLEPLLDRTIADLDAPIQAVVLSLLQRKQAFVDQSRVQHFLVHQRLTDLPPETARAALLHLARARLERSARRKISNLDVPTRQVVLGTLQRLGLFTEVARRDHLLSSSASLDSLESELALGFGRFLARQRLSSTPSSPRPVQHGADQEGGAIWQGGGRLADLGHATFQLVTQQLRQAGLLADAERLATLPRATLGEVDDQLAVQVRNELLDRLRSELAQKTMEDLSGDLRRRIHDVLDEQNYFVDEEKVGWYERKTLAQLPSNLLHGLEKYLGQIQLEGLVNTPFRALAPDMQQGLLAFFNAEGLLGDRAERLRLTQVGALAELPQQDLDAVGRHLGRRWLVSFRDRRPAALSDADRQLVWSYLRGQSYFSDAFKEELFPYQRLADFSAETQRTVETALVDHVTRLLDTQPIGQLPPDMEAAAMAALHRSDHLVDESRLRHIEETPFDQLPPDLREAVEGLVGACLLQDLRQSPIVGWAEERQQELWHYLDEIGYFVDDRKRSQALDRRLADLASDHFELAAEDLALHLEAEIGNSPVSELSDEMRQGLREAVGALGLFEDTEERARVLAQPLGSLRREDLDSLASDMGLVQLDSWAERRLADLHADDRDAIVSHLQSRDWFLDRSRIDRMQNQRLRDLAGLDRQFLAELRQRQMERLGQQRLSELNHEQRRIAYELLQQEGLLADEGQMRSLRTKKVADLDQEVVQDLLRHLGNRVSTGWGGIMFKDLGSEQQALLAAYLGRRIMGRIEQRVLLYTISRLWVDYLTEIEDLRRGIGLEAYGQRDPLVEYKRQALELFAALGDNIRRDVVRTLFRQPPEPLTNA